jgi:hypothetical protein
MRACQACGAESSDDATFCSLCYARFETADEPQAAAAAASGLGAPKRGGIGAKVGAPHGARIGPPLDTNDPACWMPPRMCWTMPSPRD